MFVDLAGLSAPHAMKPLVDFCTGHEDRAITAPCLKCSCQQGILAQTTGSQFVNDPEHAVHPQVPFPRDGAKQAIACEQEGAHSVWSNADPVVAMG